jgi:hypothetical protein
MNNNVLDMANLIEGFVLTCQTEGKSPKTIEWYTGFLTRFRPGCELHTIACFVQPELGLMMPRYSSK